MATLKFIVRTQKHFWKTMVGQAWDSVSLTEKILWIFFINNAIGIITLLEMIMLKKLK